MDDPGIVQNLVKEGKISPLTVEMISEIILCENFKWTQKEYDETDLFFIRCCEEVLSGRGAAIKSKGKK